MSAAADVSVSLVNTNSRELLLACLESLAGAEVEIVVLDNASEDGSADAVRERFPDVRVIEQPYRAGFGANHNTVIRATTGRYVFVLNEDTTSEDWGFERMVAHLDANPRVVEAARDLGARVGGRVVGDDDLELLVGLRDGGGERAREPALGVVDRDADGDERALRAHAVSFSRRCAASREASATIVSVGLT